MDPRKINIKNVKDYQKTVEDSQKQLKTVLMDCFCKNIIQFCVKVQKPYFWAILGLFGPFLPIFEKNENFPEKSGTVTFLHLWSCKKIEKTNEPILGTLHH